MEGERKKEEEKAVEEKLLNDFHQANPSTERQFIPVLMNQYPCTPSLILPMLLPALACGLPLELGSLVPHDHRPTAAALTLTSLSFIPSMKSSFLDHHPKAQGLIPKVICLGTRMWPGSLGIQS